MMGTVVNVCDTPFIDKKAEKKGVLTASLPLPPPPFPKSWMHHWLVMREERISYERTDNWLITSKFLNCFTIFNREL